jgi:hypothetical protein
MRSNQQVAEPEFRTIVSNYACDHPRLSGFQ